MQQCFVFLNISLISGFVAGFSYLHLYSICGDSTHLQHLEDYTVCSSENESKRGRFYLHVILKVVLTLQSPLKVPEDHILQVCTVCRSHSENHCPQLVRAVPGVGINIQCHKNSMVAVKLSRTRLGMKVTITKFSKL